MDTRFLDKEYNPQRRLKIRAIEDLIDHFDQLVYHNIKFTRRVSDNLAIIAEEEDLKPEERETLESALWLYAIAFCQIKFGKNKSEDILSEYHGYVESRIPEILKEENFRQHEMEFIIGIIKYAFGLKENPNRMEVAFKDALIMDLTGKSGPERVKGFYKEAVLNGLNVEIDRFYKVVIDYLLQYDARNSFGETFLQPKITEMIVKLEKEQKKFNLKKEVVIKKELSIDKLKLRELRKNYENVQGRDARGIQTLFRTTSHNHYTLNEMVDRKANIMITVNSIILSIVIGGFFGYDHSSMPLTLFLPMLVLSVASFFSILFAIISITPNKTQGRFSAEDIRNKKGNLLYFGNFQHLSEEEYEEAMLQKLGDSTYLYSSMIKDLYHLGKALNRKYKFIRISLTMFLIGLISSFIISLIYRFIAQ